MTSIPARPPVIADVARRAGVSVPTVSRVLTGAARVSDEKRRRVEQAIAELGYRPSATARALKLGRARTVAVLAGNTSRHGYAVTLEGIEEAARAAGHVVVIGVVEDPEPSTVAAAMDPVLAQPLAGVIVLTFDPPGVAALAAVPAGLPVVAVAGARTPGIAQVVIDEDAGAAELTRHLLAEGHATVHHVSVPPSRRREDGRTRGWRKALREAGVPIPPVLPATWDPTSGVEIGRELADRADVTAVFCGNDEIAMGVIRGLAEGGRTVPDDVSVAGFDDHPLARLWTPPLTTVRQDFTALGQEAFALLARQIEAVYNRVSRPPARLVRHDAPLVVRASTGRPPVVVRHRAV
jgi:DNA-binding LacI/PurR family transcriptional regulator